MPFIDILEAKKVWTETKQVILNGDIVKGFKTNKKGKTSRITNFPGKKYNSVSHVRPHTTNSSHTFPLPVIDKITKQMEYTKHCFWLNNTYVRDEIYLK